MSTFYSQGNRQLLLGLLSHNELYQSNPQYFVSIFNETIENIERRKISYNSLMDMNKAVIKEMSNLKKNVIAEKNHQVRVQFLNKDSKHMKKIFLNLSI